MSHPWKCRTFLWRESNTYGLSSFGESQTHLSIVNRLPRIQILKNTMVWEKFSDTILLLSEFTNGQQIAIQVWNQKNKVKS